jgi:hypothetical protein
MAAKYTNIFYCKSLPNLAKLGFWYENMSSGNPASQWPKLSKGRKKASFDVFINKLSLFRVVQIEEETCTRQL